MKPQSRKEQIAKCNFAPFLFIAEWRGFCCFDCSKMATSIGILLSIMLLFNSKGFIHVEFYPTGETKNSTAYIENIIICYNYKKRDIVIKRHSLNTTNTGLQICTKGTLWCEVYWFSSWHDSSGIRSLFFINGTTQCILHLPGFLIGVAILKLWE